MLLTTNWILVMIYFGYGPVVAINSIPDFKTEQACKDAGFDLHQKMRVTYYCVFQEK